METVADNVANKIEHLQRQADSIRAANLSCTMGIVEWNYWTRASHNDHAGFFEPNDIRHCLYAAGYLNAFCRLGEIMEIANYYSLVNTMGMIHLHDGQVQFSDVVKVFNLYAPALPGEVLELTVSAPPLTEKSKVVDANVIRKGNTLYGFLTNYSATETVEATLTGVDAIFEAQGLSASAILEPVREFVPSFTQSTVTLPPMSLVRVSSKGNS
jgi:alpha-L-arabinofuranosidase